MVEFFKTVGVGVSLVPLAIAVVAVAAGLIALWAPSAKRQARAIQVLKIVLRVPAERREKSRRSEPSQSTRRTENPPGTGPRRDTPR